MRKKVILNCFKNLETRDVTCDYEIANAWIQEGADVVAYVSTKRHEFITREIANVKENKITRAKEPILTITTKTLTYYDVMEFGGWNKDNLVTSYPGVLAIDANDYGG